RCSACVGYAERVAALSATAWAASTTLSSIATATAIAHRPACTERSASTFLAPILSGAPQPAVASLARRQRDTRQRQRRLHAHQRDARSAGLPSAARTSTAPTRAPAAPARADHVDRARAAHHLECPLRAAAAAAALSRLARATIATGHPRVAACCKASSPA